MTYRRKRLGELVLRSDNPQRLVEFYQNILGLELFAKLGSATFLKVADDLEGHPQLLAIFDKSHTFSAPQDFAPGTALASAGTLHHFAFVLEPDDFIVERKRLEDAGFELQLAEHRQFGWRSLYLFDPDGNNVELVCFDPDLLKTTENRPE